jgi:CRP/FNR family transcriptional regulator
MSSGCQCERKYAQEVEEFCSECIGQFWIFQGLSAGELEALVERTVKGLYTESEYIFHQGDAVDRMFLIKAGRVRLHKIFEDGSEILLDIRKAGDFIGEQLFSEDQAEFPVSAVCAERTLICGFSREVLEQLIREYPNIGLQVIKNMSRRIDSMASRVEGMSAIKLEDRLYNVLCQVAREHGRLESRGRVIGFPLTHEDLSFLVGAHRVSVTRAMKSLRDAGLIEQRKQQIVLP